MGDLNTAVLLARTRRIYKGLVFLEVREVLWGWPTAGALHVSEVLSSLYYGPPNLRVTS